MCGILAVLGCVDIWQAKRARIIELSRRLKHRGPDWSGIHCHEDCYLAHQRLAIVDPASGDQPLYNEDKTVVVTVDGEIYNHKELKEQLKNHQFRTGSDCEVIAHLFEEYGEEFVDMLDGMFSFVLLDTRNKSYIAARDAVGITPLYMGWGPDGSVWFASEMKALSDDCERFISFPPGHLYSSKSGGLRRWYNPPWFSETIPSAPYDGVLLRQAFEKAVTKTLMTDVPFGVLLSGGLVSSLVASVASRHLAASEGALQWGSQLHTFSVGLKDSPDLKAARQVARYLGTRHHEFPFTVQEGIDALEEVIYHIETYDVTTIRDSTPMFLMSRKIKSLGVKMVLSGGGSDEVFGGCKYFPEEPNEEYHKKTCRKISALHLYDCLRANKLTSAWGVEARVPFLDKELINLAMNIDPGQKMDPGEKMCTPDRWILRHAFNDEEKPYLQENILYRQKDEICYGVGYSWIIGLKDHANNQVTDAMLMNASILYPENTPRTKEAYYYRSVFEKFFPKSAGRLTVPGGPSVACSTEAHVDEEDIIEREKEEEEKAREEREKVNDEFLESYLRPNISNRPNRCRDFSYAHTAYQDSGSEDTDYNSDLPIPWESGSDSEGYWNSDCDEPPDFNFYLSRKPVVMNEADRLLYEKKLSESEGFDLDGFERFTVFPSIQPVHMISNRPHITHLYWARFAVITHRMQTGENLYYKKIVKANEQYLEDGHEFYFTLELKMVKDKSGGDGVKKYYRAQVRTFNKGKVDEYGVKCRSETGVLRKFVEVKCSEVVGLGGKTDLEDLDASRRKEKGRRKEGRKDFDESRRIKRIKRFLKEKIKKKRF